MLTSKDSIKQSFVQPGSFCLIAVVSTNCLVGCGCENFCS